MTPKFTRRGYRALLERLADLRYQLVPVDRLEHDPPPRAVFLRHDVDAHLAGTGTIAKIEEACGARSSWHIRVDGPYNPWHAPNRARLQALRDHGHTIGLHIPAASNLGHVPLPVQPTSLSIHRPAQPPELPAGVAYISDSGRAWRQDVPLTIQQLLAGDGPAQVVLLTHHEHWLGAVEEPALADHFDRMAGRAIDDHRAAILDELQAAATHPAVPQPEPQPEPLERYVDKARLDGRFPHAHVHPAAVISSAAVVCPGAYIGPGVYIGPGCFIGPNTSIGQPGFGYTRQPDGSLKYRAHDAGVAIEDGVHIGANTCIDQGRHRATRIKRGARIDNHVHIAHNVIVGHNCAVIAHAMLAGTVTVGDRAVINPGAQISDHVTIGEDAVVGIGSVVRHDVPAGETWAGNPARKLR